MAQCLSVSGPPPHCGHTPTPEAPICAICQASHDKYLRDWEEKLVRDAKRVLESRGYIVSKMAP